MSTRKRNLHWNLTSCSRTGRIRTVSSAKPVMELIILKLIHKDKKIQNLQCALVATVSGLLAIHFTEKLFWVLTTFDLLRMSTLGDDLWNPVRTRSTILMTDSSTLVAMLAVFPDSSTSFHAEILLMSLIIGMARQLTCVTTWKPGCARLVAASFRKILSDIFTMRNFLQLKVIKSFLSKQDDKS